MKIVSWNVNGLRSVYQKGFPAWLEKSGADIVCVQEVKAQASTVPQDLFSGSKYSFIANYAERPGYSGVGVYIKEKPKKIEMKLGHARFDSERPDGAAGLPESNVYWPLCPERGA